MFGRCLDACCRHTEQRRQALSDWGGVHMHPIHLDASICLDTPICLDVPHTFGCPIHVMASKHTGGSQTYGGHPKIQGVSNIGGTQTYRGHPNKWVCKCTGGHPNIWGCPNIWGHPNIQGVHPNIWWHLDIQGASKHTGGSTCMGAYEHPLSLTKHTFFVLCMYRGHPNIIQTYGGI